MDGTSFRTLRHTLLAALCSGFALAACGAQVEHRPQTGIASESGIDVLTDASVPNDDAQSDGAIADVIVQPPADAGTNDVSVPVVGCTVPAVNAPIDAGGCAFPPSQCTDGRTLAFFTNASCVAGQCRWDIQYMHCPNGCFTGGCAPNHTTAM